MIHAYPEVARELFASIKREMPTICEQMVRYVPEVE